MVRYSKQKKDASPQTQDEALKVARATQQPGQTKEQTKLIAQGIQKGIEEYKKQYKARSRELNRKVKQVTAQSLTPPTDAEPVAESTTDKRSLTPWLLLLLSWALFAAYVFWTRS